MPVETVPETMDRWETETTQRHLDIDPDDRGEAHALLYARQQQARAAGLARTSTSPRLHRYA